LISNGPLMIKVNVKLFGVLSHPFRDYNPDHGLDVEIPDRATYEELLTHLKISKQEVGMVSVEGALVKPGERLQNGTRIRIFQPVLGG